MKHLLQARMFKLFICAVAVVITVGVTGQRSYGQERKAINLAAARGLPFSDGIVAGDTLYVAGQEGTDDSGKLAAGASAQRQLRPSTISRRWSRPLASN